MANFNYLDRGSCHRSNPILFYNPFIVWTGIKIKLASTAARRDASRPCIDGGAPLIHRSVTRLPGRRSSEFIRWEIRSHSDVPVIITTGHRLDEIDRIVGLELGADDYIVKPFSLRELLARLRAVLRRQEMERVARTRDPERGGYRFEGWQLERRGRRLFDPNATPIALSKGEYALLLAFLEAPQRLLSREHLLQATRIHEDIFDRSIIALPVQPV